MTDFLIDPHQADVAGTPLILAVRQGGGGPRLTETHHHARGQLLGAMHGLVTVGTELGQWVVPAIHCVWLPPHHPHSFRSHGAFDGWSVYVAEEACARLPEAPCTMRSSGLLREAVLRAVQREPSPHLAAVIFDEIRTLPRERLGLPMPKDSRLAKIARAVLADLADNRRLEEWVADAGASARTVTRLFPRETGFSFTEWRQQARLMRALELLSAGEPVTAVAFELGYETVSAFIALFRRHFGVTPGRY